mgnify:CR=1 FL=1
MFRSQVLRDVIEIHPRCLSKDWKHKFLQTLQKEKNRTVNARRGAILNVQDVINYGTPKTFNGKIFTEMEYKAICFIPVVGEVYSGTITLVLPLGLLIEAEGLVKVLIQPINMPIGYKFDTNRKVFSNGIHSFGVDDNVSFKILSYRHKPGKIDCVGTIKDVSQSKPDEVSEPVGPDEPVEPDDRFLDF